MNNNNRNNNRRRGRGNRNQGGGGNSSNRIDSRARGNAPQLLDKYKKLAQDAQHNGDRVQAEYYLQFADHYFRVIADNKARQDEQRAKRDNERGQANDDSSDDDDDDRGSDNRNDGRNDGRNDDRRKPKKSNRNEKQRGKNRDSSDSDDSDDEDEDVFEAEDNPFVRKRKAPAKRASSRKRDDDRGDDGEDSEIDATVLPPAIAAATADEDDRSDARKAGDARLAYRLLAMLEAGERAGGDARGRQSAAIVVGRIGGEVTYDLRVDDAEDPLRELRRLIDLRAAERGVEAAPLSARTE